MITFDPLPALAALCSLASLAHAADELSLRGNAGEKLSGTVTGIEESGVIALSSPLTTEPLRLQPNAVTKVRFDVNQVDSKPTSMLVELANGDRLPVEILSYSADKGMQVTTPAVGELALAPSMLASLELGVTARKLVFDGPGETSQWRTSGKDGFSNVTIDGKDWTIGGRLEAARSIQAPANFVLRFSLQWEPRQQPNIKIHFASPDVNSVTKADRYFLQFNSAGFEIKRERAKISFFPPILNSSRKPEEFAARQVDVEIHVNRTTKRIELYLNGEFEAWGEDPEPATPTGGGIILGINGMNGTSQTIRNLTLHELNNTRVRHRAEDRGNPDRDSLLSRDDDRWTGDLLAIRKEGARTDVLFQIPQRKEALEIPIEEISTVFFRKKTAPATPAQPAAKYRLQLHGEGGLSVKSCRIADGKITVNHPLLGELEIAKNAILGIEPVANDQPNVEDPER